MKTEIKILKWLIQNNRKPTISELAKGIKADYKITHSAATALHKKELIEITKVGKSSQIKFIHKFSDEVFLAENERKKDILKNTNIRVIYNDMQRLEFPIIGLVFGSHVKGTAGRHSDIDIMIICEKTRVETTESMLYRFESLNIHPNVFSIEDFISMAKSKEFTVISEAIRHHILLIGMEDFYRLMENVGRTTY